FVAFPGWLKNFSSRLQPSFMCRGTPRSQAGQRGPGPWRSLKMRTTIARIGVTGAGALLAVGLFAAVPAGASGSAGHGINSQDSSCFTATGHTQGRSHSDPDGMSNGGADKPGCPGGFDADQDGNNGCGNDADREDDNNGRCGRQKAGPADAGPTGPAAPTSSTTTTSTSTTTTTGPAATVAPTVEP